MTTAQITLTETESQALQALSRLKGKTQEELLHEAVDHILAQHKTQDRLTALRQARGIWKEREDIPTVEELQREWDRYE